ncbi:MAG: PQQ-binding-like beta-propeller repeat protein [Thermoplasmata archaeon]|nr:PQQ-binding-like beta-propeller repeat protein [Thermoplasmata archaeon]
MALFFLIGGAASGWEVVIEEPADDSIVDGMVTIKGVVNEDLLNDTGEVSNVNISIDGGGQVIVDQDGIRFSKWHYDWDTTHLSNGEATLTAHLVIREETGGSGNESRYDYWEEDPFTISVTVQNTPPTAEILSPLGGATIEFGTLVHFNGSGTPGPGRTIVAFDWRSDRDLALSDNASFGFSTLSPGNHMIRLRVTDDLGIDSVPAMITVSVVLPMGDQWPFPGGNLLRNGVAAIGPEIAYPDWNYTIDREAREFTAPVIHGWFLIAGENVDDGTGRYGILHAFDLNGTYDGVQGKAVGRSDVIWNVTLPRSITAVPACRHTRVYVGAEWSPETPTLYCFDLWTGVELWNASIGTVFGSPAVTEDMVVVVTGENRVWAFEPDAGGVLWTAHLPDFAMASPLVVGGRAFIACGDGFLRSLDLDDGSELGAFDLGGFHTASPIFDSDKVFMIARAVVGDDDSLVARDRFDLTDTGPGAWTYTPGGRMMASPVAWNGTVIAITQAGRVMAFDTAGAMLWDLELNDTIVSTPVIGGDLMYVPSETGILHVIDLGEGMVSWNSSHNGPLTSPALFEDVIAFGDAGELVALWNRTMPEASIASIAPATIPGLPPAELWYKVGIPGNPITISEGVPIEMAGIASDRSGSDIVAWVWTSSIDGPIGNASTITVEPSRGLHTIGFRVQNSEAAWSAWVTEELSIVQNDRPTVRLETDMEHVGEFTHFDLGGSADLDGSIHIFVVDFGDGSEPVFGYDQDIIITHQYAYENNYGVKITAYDDHGLASDRFSLFLRITEKVDEEPGTDGEEDGGILAEGRGSILAAVILVLIVVVASFFYMRSKGSAKSRKSKKGPMVEFEEEVPEPEVDAKEEALEQIQARVAMERRAHRRAAKGKHAPAKAKAAPRRGKKAGKAEAEKTAGPSSGRVTKAAQPPAVHPSKAEVPRSTRKEPVTPTSERAPTTRASAKGTKPSPTAKGQPIAKDDAKPAKGPGTSEANADVATKATEAKPAAERRTSLEDLLSELESMKK